MRVMMMVGERWGPHAEVQKLTRSDTLVVVVPIRFSGKIVAYEGTGVHGKTYGELLAAIERHDVQKRRYEAVEWRAAAFHAAAQGYDVRDPAKQLNDWIENGE